MKNAMAKSRYARLQHRKWSCFHRTIAKNLKAPNFQVPKSRNNFFFALAKWKAQIYQQALHVSVKENATLMLHLKRDPHMGAAQILSQNLHGIRSLKCQEMSRQYQQTSGTEGRKGNN